MTQESFSLADIRLITGEQGGGKSETLCAYPVDDYFKHLTGILSPNGEIISAKAIDKADSELLRQAGVFPNKLRYVHIFSDDGEQSKIIKIPQDFMALSPVKIFANFTLYGIQYAPIWIADIIEYINTEEFNDAWILADESVMTDARNSMDLIGKNVALFGASIRKRKAHFCLAAQYNEMVERRFRLFATTTILCSYDKTTKYITLNIKKKGEDAFETDYYAPNYWGFFDTNELIKVPQHKIDRALARIYQTELAR